MTAREDVDRDDGFTIVELSIVLLLLGVVMASLLGLLASQTNFEKKLSDVNENEMQIREALVLLQRDLRSSEPLVLLPSPLDYRWRVDLKVYEQVTDPEPVIVRWEIVPGGSAPTVNDQLVRSVVGADGTALTTYRLRGVQTRRDGRHLFAYFKRGDDTSTNVRYDLEAAGTTTGSIVACTVRLRIDLSAAPNGSPSSAPRVASDVQLRNWVPGAVGCP